MSVRLRYRHNNLSDSKGLLSKGRTCPEVVQVYFAKQLLAAENEDIGWRLT